MKTKPNATLTVALSALVLNVLIAPTAFAQTPVLLSIKHSSTLFQPGDIVASQIDVFADGEVIKTDTTESRTVESTPTAKQIRIGNLAEMLNQIKTCVDELDTKDFKSAATLCQDDPGTHYFGKLGQKEFASKYCGVIQAIPGLCAQEMMGILDALDNLANLGIGTEMSEGQ